MCSHEAPCVRWGPTSDSQRRAGCPAYFIHSPSPKRRFLEEDYISRVQLDFTSETIKLGQDDAESTQHCCPGGSWAFDVGTITFGASMAAPRPSNCICLQREASGLSVVIIILDLKPFLLVDYWSSQLWCCGNGRSETKRENISVCKRRRQSRGKAGPRGPTLPPPLILFFIITVQQFPLLGHHFPFFLPSGLFL